MRTALTPAQMGAVDRFMMDRMKIPGLILMENAAHGVFEAIREEIQPCSVQVFCGTGNNGGDGFAVARILIANGYDVQVIVLGDTKKLPADAATNYSFFEENGEYCRVIQSETDFEELAQAEVYVDALFGTGLTRDVSGIYATAIEHINAQDSLVVSVDIPSGIHAESGAVMGVAVEADITVTFQYPKIGHFLFPGREYAGELQVVRIGVDEGSDVPLQSNVCVYESDDEDMCLGQRDLNTNKGSYGRLLLVAGSYGMAGAAVLSARAASRAGAGLVTLASCKEVVDVLQQNVPEATCVPLPGKNGSISGEAAGELERLLEGKTAVAMGPGLGSGDSVAAVIGALITNYDITKVIDADAINALAGHMEFLDHMKGEAILTPHPKEFSRLSGLELQEILQNPLKAAVDFAVEYEVTLVLKGSTTIIADQFGNATLVCVGTPGMAKGGSGDVLTGIIAGFAAQGKDPYEAALAGVYIAGMAGERAAELEGEYSMTPMDAVNSIGYAIDQITVDYITADTVKKREKSVKPSDLQEALPKEEKPEKRKEQEEEPAEEMPIEEPELPEPEVEEPPEEEFSEEVVTGETKVVREPVREKIPDFLEKYADDPQEPVFEERPTRVQQRKAKERKPLFPRRAKEIVEEHSVEEPEATPEALRREVMKELPKTDGDKPTRRRIG